MNKCKKKKYKCKIVTTVVTTIIVIIVVINYSFNFKPKIIIGYYDFFFNRNFFY